MREFSIFRLEVNYFLYLVQSVLGDEQKALAEEALDMLITYFFFLENKEFCEDYIERIETYISQLSCFENDNDYKVNVFKNNVQNISRFLGEIQKEIC